MNFDLLESAPAQGAETVANVQTPIPRPVRIIAIDGGGVGGIIPIRLIERLLGKLPDLLAKTDILTGTSTGGLIALGLAGGLSPQELRQLYQKWIPQIFSTANKRLWPCQMFRSKFRPAGLQSAVEAIVGARTLGQLNKAVVIPVLGLERPQPVRPAPSRHIPAGIFLSTAHRLVGNSRLEKYNSGAWTCLDVALATSAAPTYFPAHHVNNQMVGRWRLWDGGLVANNPALVAVGEIMRITGVPNPDVRVLSFGTGYQDIRISAGDWGYLHYNAARSVISAQLDASVGSTAFLMRQIFGDNAVRVSVPLALDGGFKIDDPSVIGRLLKETDLYYENSLAKVIQPDAKSVDLLSWLHHNW